MTIHFAPIPQIKSLWQALLLRPSVGKPWLNMRTGGFVRFYSRGMWALAEGTKIILEKRNKKEGKIWLPDYFCNEPLAPLRNSKISLYFYPIKGDILPDWDKIERALKEYGPPDVFLLVHYFGFPNSVEKAKEFCENCGAELFEDAAHLLLPIEGMGQNMVLFSPRKLLPIPEGGILVIPERFHGYQKRENHVDEAEIVFKWLAHRLTQRMLLFFHIPWHRIRKFSTSKKNGTRYNNEIKKLNIFPNAFTLKILSSIEKGLDLIVEKRRKNYLQLCQAIDRIKGARPLFPSLPDQVCPYMFPLVITEGKNAIKRQLLYQGIPASSWPDLPGEILEKKDTHETAIWLKDHILLLPIHQNLSIKQMERMSSLLREILKKGPH